MSQNDPPTTTRAAVLVETSKPLRVLELEIPSLKPGQVLVDIAYSGVCHSQINEARGLRGADRYLPHALGHEGSGTVIVVGDSVTKVKPGDRVILTWLKGGGADVPSTVYDSAIGPVNSGAISTFMHQAVVSENRLVPLPDAMPFREAALLGCAVPTGSGIVFNTLEVEAGESIAIFGAGGIGLSAVMAASIAKAGIIIAVDIREERLIDARTFGATHVVNALKDDVSDVISAVTEGRGVDYAIESAGNKDAVESAFQAVRNGGGVCVIAGNPPHGTRFSIDPFDLIRGKRLLGSWGGESRPDLDLPKYAEMYRRGDMTLEKFLGREYALDEIDEALSDLESGKSIRPLIRL